MLYSVSIDYPRLFPIFAFLPGQTETYSLSTSTVLRNQPYGDQNSYAAPVTRNCP